MFPTSPTPVGRAGRVSAAREIAALLVLGAYLLYMTGGGLRTDFSHDDLMNLYRGWVSGPLILLKEIVLFFRPSPSYRPLGSLFYSLSFSAFDFHHASYRTVLLIFLLANLGWTYLLTRSLTHSPSVSFLAALAHGYQPGFGQLYRNTGFCYDILCYFFYAGALTLYLRIRAGGRHPNAWQTAMLLGLLVLALDSKEIAVSWPVIVLAYELILSPPAGWRDLLRWCRREGRTALFGGIVVAAFLFGRVFGHDGLAAVYVPSYRIEVWAANWAAWFHSLAVPLGLRPGIWSKALLALPVAALAALPRRKEFLFAALFALVGALPISFIDRQDLAEAYLPTAGVAMAAAILISAISARFASPLVTAGLCVAFLIHTYAPSRQALRAGADAESKQIRAVLEELRSKLHPAKRTARVLVLTDPFQRQANKHWAMIFLSRLVTRDDTITIHRLVRLPAGPNLASYDHVITFRNDELQYVPPSRSQEWLERATLVWQPLPVGWGNEPDR